MTFWYFSVFCNLFKICYDSPTIVRFLQFMCTPIDPIGVHFFVMCLEEMYICTILYMHFYIHYSWGQLPCQIKIVVHAFVSCTQLTISKDKGHSWFHMHRLTFLVIFYMNIHCFRNNIWKWKELSQLTPNQSILPLEN